MQMENIVKQLTTKIYSILVSVFMFILFAIVSILCCASLLFLLVITLISVFPFAIFSITRNHALRLYSIYFKKEIKEN